MGGTDDRDEQALWVDPRVDRPVGLLQGDRPDPFDVPLVVSIWQSVDFRLRSQADSLGRGMKTTWPCTWPTLRSAALSPLV